MLIDFFSSRSELELITEWATPDLLSLPMAPLLLALLLLMWGGMRGRIMPRDLIVIGPFLVLAFSANRSVPPAWIGLSPFVASSLQGLKVTPQHPRRVLGLANAILVVALIVGPLIPPQAVELDEGMFLLGLRAAAQRLPFLPTRAGLGSDVLRINPHLKTVRSPYEDGEELVAVPALELDVAFIHVNRADEAGNGQILGRDPYFENLFCMCAKRACMSCEKVLPSEELVRGGPLQSLAINRMMVEGVVETPGGAHFTECPPDYGRDEAFQREYSKTAKDPRAWDAFREKYLEVDEADYQKAVKP